MADNTMLMILLLGGAAAFAYSQGMLGNIGGGGDEAAPEPAPVSGAQAPVSGQVPATTQTTPLPTQVNPIITNVNVQRPPVVIVNQQPPIAVTAYNRFIIMNQLSPTSIDLAYTRVAQYIVYFHTGNKGPIDWRWISFARDRARLGVSKSHHHKMHGKFADKLIEVAYRIQYQPGSPQIEILARDCASLFQNLEQVDPQLLIRNS